ncbi:MAG: hypothetical protein WBW34_08265 [Nitrososphaeraceae archaeon]
MTRTREVAGKEILASTTPPADSRKNFDIRDFMKHYSRELQTRDRNIHSTTSSNKLTLKLIVGRELSFVAMEILVAIVVAIDYVMS